MPDSARPPTGCRQPLGHDSQRHRRGWAGAFRQAEHLLRNHITQQGADHLVPQIGGVDAIAVQQKGRFIQFGEDRGEVEEQGAGSVGGGAPLPCIAGAAWLDHRR